MIVRTWGSVVLATAAICGGCGSGSVAKASFLDRANAVCSASGARIGRLAWPGRRRLNSSGALQAGFVDAYAAEMRDELNRLRKLGYPAGDRAVLQRLYAGLTAALASDERQPAAFNRRALAGMNQQLRDYGMTACRT